MKPSPYFSPNKVTTLKQPYSPPTLNAKRWSPKKWKPVFDEMVLLSLTGQTNVDIAVKYGYSPQHICVIFASPRAKALRRKLAEKLSQDMEATIEERVSQIKNNALKRLDDFFKNDDIAANAPVAMAGKSIEILKGTGVLKAPEGTGGIHADKAVILTGDAVDSFREGLAKSKEAAQLHSGLEAIDVTPKK